jgi:hypothetical protein
MDPLQNDTWSPLGQAPEAAAETPAPAGTADNQRHWSGARRRFDRGGRRRADWPEDAGLSCCPGCGHDSLQSLGVLDSGDYLWQCPRCDRRFQTGRATRTML